MPELDPEVNRILSHPDFDPLVYFKYIDLHTRINQLTSTLLKQPEVFLAILESDHHRYLESENASYMISPPLLLTLNEAGYELWHKKSVVGNMWYGLIHSDDCVVYWKEINSSRDIYIDKLGHKMAWGYRSAMTTRDNQKNHRNADWWREEWKRLGLRKVGEKVKEGEVIKPQPGNRPIDKIRQEVFDLFKKLGFTGWRTKNWESSFSVNARNPSTSGGWSHTYSHYVEGKIMARGKSIFVEIETKRAQYHGSRYVSREIANTKIPMCETYAETAGKIVDWIASNNKHKPLRVKLDAYRKELQNACV